jgi:succinate dehydrogenase / fumarate reductase membrane anchor subunit
MIDKAAISSPGTHYGDPKAATRLFRLQRLTGALNIGFLAFFAWLVLNLAGADRASMLALFHNPVVAILCGLLLVSAGLHMRIGMLEVIEDYVATPARNHLAVLINDIVAYGAIILGLLALLKLLIWG